jgi:hypothetical protein
MVWNDSESIHEKQKFLMITISFLNMKVLREPVDASRKREGKSEGLSQGKSLAHTRINRKYNEY